MIDPIDKKVIKPLFRKIPLLANTPIEKINLQALSGQSNRNYLLSTEIDQYVLRIPKQSTQKHIKRDNEFHNTKIAHQLGLTPKILWHDETGISLRPYLSFTQELRPDTFSSTQLASLLNKLQNSQYNFKGLLDNQKIARQLEAYYQQCSPKQQKENTNRFKETINLIKGLEENPHPDIKEFVPAHIDLIKENILIDQKSARIWLIDWEYSAMASPFWDIAMLSNSLKLNKQQSIDLLRQTKPDYGENEAKILYIYRIITNNINILWKLAHQ